MTILVAARSPAHPPSQLPLISFSPQTEYRQERIQKGKTTDLLYFLFQCVDIFSFSIKSSNGIDQNVLIDSK